MKTGKTQDEILRDKLIEALKRLTDAHYNGKAQGSNWINASQLLKQAEQK